MGVFDLRYGHHVEKYLMTETQTKIVWQANRNIKTITEAGAEIHQALLL